MSAGADYILGADVSGDVVIAAFAGAYGIPVSRVAILPDGEFHAWPDADVVLNVIALAGDYPSLVTTWDDDERHQRTIAAALASWLGVPVLASGESYDPSDMELALPDGSIHRVSVTQDDDDGFRNTPEMRRLIADARTHVRAA